MFFANLVDQPVSSLNNSLSKLPVSVRMMLMSPIILCVIIITMIETPFVALYGLIASAFVKPQPWPTPREIYKRTGLKVNGYNQ